MTADIIQIPNRAQGRLVKAISASDVYINLSFQEAQDFINVRQPYQKISGVNVYVYALVIGITDREIIRIDASGTEDPTFIPVDRGAGAIAWPAGTLILAVTTAELYSTMAQQGNLRTIDYNPNQVLVPNYGGEKVYQNAPAGCERWWKAYGDVNPYWDIITGVPCGIEDYTDIGWDYDLLIGAAAWDSYHDNTEWEPYLGLFGTWNVGGWWDSYLSGTDNVQLSVIGSWYLGYQPQKLRVSITPNSLSTKIQLKIGNNTNQIQDYSPLDDGDEFDIPSAWYLDGDGNIARIEFFRAHIEGEWDLTNLEWQL